MRLALRSVLLGVLVVLGLLVLTCVSAPVRWWLKPDRALRVQVLDKTVPHRDYREHAALYWVLRHEKVPAVDGDRTWAPAEHYRGFHPDPADGEAHGTGDVLIPDDLRDADLLYLADAYGVYRGDYEQGGRAALDYSPMIYGGVQVEEVAAIEEFVAGGGNLVAEFNTFASPTGGEARARLEALLGVDWSGWSGRYFVELADDAEVPAWAARLWRRHHGTEWSFHGPGYLLVHEDTRIAVLREPFDVQYPGLALHTVARHPLVAGVLENVRFTYWFDVVARRPGSQVVASFRFEPTDSGRAILDQQGIPMAFPAVVIAGERPFRAYLAGDFSDAGGSLGPHWAEGLPWLNRALLRLRFPRQSGHEPFYWGFYIPLTTRLLEQLDAPSRPTE